MIQENLLKQWATVESLMVKENLLLCLKESGRSKSLGYEEANKVADYCNNFKLAFTNLQKLK